MNKKLEDAQKKIMRSTLTYPPLTNRVPKGRPIAMLFEWVTNEAACPAKKIASTYRKNIVKPILLLLFSVKTFFVSGPRKYY